MVWPVVTKYWDSEIEEWKRLKELKEIPLFGIIIHLCANVQAFTHAYIYAYIHTQVHTYVHTYVEIYTSMNIPRTNMHACMHTKFQTFKTGVSMLQDNRV